MDNNKIITLENLILYNDNIILEVGILTNEEVRRMYLNAHPRAKE